MDHNTRCYEKGGVLENGSDCGAVTHLRAVSKERRSETSLSLTGLRASIVAATAQTSPFNGGGLPAVAQQATANEPACSPYISFVSGPLSGAVVCGPTSGHSPSVCRTMGLTR
ncbi:hypothetical protein MRX96_037676 [Rhipicephalus microplus]